VGDLPVLGRLFSNQQDSGQRTELVLAITPRILRNVRRPDANETELWVGTETVPKLRPVGGLRALAETGDDAPIAAAKPSTAVSLATDPAAPAAAGPQLKWAGPADAKVGDTVELKVALQSATPLRGMPMEITFSKDKLQLLDAAEGDYFRQDGAPTSFSKSGDAKEGRLNAGVLRNQARGAAGQGTVLTLRFKALAAGTGEVRIHQAQPIALGAGIAPPALPLPWTVQIR
jgi:general secretion pathway protein D